jgi:hypothetical protein
MSKIVKSKNPVKIEEIYDADSDSDIEQKPVQKTSKRAIVKQPEPELEPVPVIAELPPVKVKKPRKPYTMSEETRQKKSETMLKVREKKMEYTTTRKQQNEELLRLEEENIQKVVAKKILAEKKKREKKLYQKYVAETIEQSESESEEEEDYVPKTPRRKAAPRKKAVEQEQEQEYEAPVYQPIPRSSLNYF